MYGIYLDFLRKKNLEDKELKKNIKFVTKNIETKMWKRKIVNKEKEKKNWDKNSKTENCKQRNNQAKNQIKTKVKIQNTNPIILEKWTKAAVWATRDWLELSPGDVLKTPNWLSHRVCEPTFDDIPEAINM